ncbi:haloacid dehalogenase, type II [Nitrospirillum viridazoti Y2]|uniref:(S)-2-haloacid dehalogenase n=1 Tax=Nitrospirillum amazonense TaxID=28077 RepID=A0A560HLV5_9PROT|nr:haloacid dehalogenase type II [Nitrospirillum amazonense]EGY02548.1 haloacid dehalogenase, type II [Nitrospirillum amazonense Y2]TWB47517.1 2-haloacid dehalogenase [Nitrospirillum amazonense]
MKVTLAFDVYGTLIDTHGLVAVLREMVGDRAADFSRTWRERQLEYAFRRALMQNYVPFSVCTAQALDHTCALYKTPFSPEQRMVLLDAYRTLPAFADVADGLARLRAAGFRLYAFSNGAADAVRTLLDAAGISGLFQGVVSTDDLRSFKPSPAVYSHFLRAAGATHAEAWLVSSNPFDVIGALSAGWRAAWVQRSPEALFDPWGISPTVTVADLRDLAAAIAP